MKSKDVNIFKTSHKYTELLSQWRLLWNILGKLLFFFIFQVWMSISIEITKLYFGWSIVLSDLHTLTHVILTATLWDRYCHPHSKVAVKGWKPRPSDTRVFAFNLHAKLLSIPVCCSFSYSPLSYSTTIKDYILC